MKVTAKKKLFKGEFSLKSQSLLVRPFAKNGKQGSAGSPVTTGATKRVGGVVFVLIITTFASLYFLHPFAPESTHADTIGTTVNSTTYYVSIDSAGSVSTSIEAGQMGAFGKAKDTLTVNSVTPQGFRLYISMTGADNHLYTPGQDDPSISAAAGSSMQPTTLDNNQWGWATDYVSGLNNFDHATGTDYNNADKTYHYAGMPTSGSESSLAELATAPGNVTDMQVPVYYGFYVNNALPSGTYSGTVQYSAVAEAAPQSEETATATDVASLNGGTVIFTTSLMSGLDPGEATVTINNGSSEVACTNPTTAISPSTDTVTVTCTAPAMTYPGEYQATIHLVDYGKTYSTIVKYAPGTGFASQTKGTITTLQDMTPEFCVDVAPATAPPATDWANITYGTLTDSRDNNEYLVGKLADGNCWMLQNLRLDLDSSTPLTSDKTNITSDWTPSTSTQKDSTQVQWTPDCNEDGSITVDDIPCAADTPRSYKVGSGILGDTQTTNTNYGNYYNWSAATAGTRSTSAGAGEATGDICPKGWRLPTSAGDKSWHNLLFTTYGLTDNSSASNTKALAAPFYLLYSGNYRWFDSRVYNQGSDGAWWSSAAHSSSNARHLSMATTPRLIPQNGRDRAYGFSVRCVAQ